MFKLALATLLRITDPTQQATPHYTAAQFSQDLRYTRDDLSSNLPFTLADWEKTKGPAACQCLTLKISPDGSMVVGLARPCSCDE